MAQATVYSMGSTLPCGHKLNPRDEFAPRLLQKAGDRGKLRCPRCNRERWFLIDDSVTTFQQLWNERFLKSLQDVKAKIAKQEMWMERYRKLFEDGETTSAKMDMWNELDSIRLQDGETSFDQQDMWNELDSIPLQDDEKTIDQQDMWNELDSIPLQDDEKTIDQQDEIMETHWEKAPKLEKFMREPPTEEEEKKHEEIKQTLTERQKIATDALKGAFRRRNTEFLLCEDDLEDADEVTDILQFILSDYANAGSEELQSRKKEAIPVLRLTKAHFDSSEDVEFEGKRKLLKKGNLFYHYEPGSDWFKVGLKVSGRYEDEDWYKSSDESKAWTIAYHGSNVAGNQAIAEERRFETAGKRQLHRYDTDINPFGTRFGEMCGTGAYFSNDFDVALGFAEKAANGETCVFEVHLKPSEMRVPEGNFKYAIVNNHIFARPTGICIRRSVEKPASCQLM